jgi:hypothetical protein
MYAADLLDLRPCCGSPICQERSHDSPAFLDFSPFAIVRRCWPALGAELGASVRWSRVYGRRLPPAYPTPPAAARNRASDPDHVERAVTGDVDCERNQAECLITRFEQCRHVGHARRATRRRLPGDGHDRGHLDVGVPVPRRPACSLALTLSILSPAPSSHPLHSPQPLPPARGGGSGFVGMERAHRMRATHR